MNKLLPAIIFALMLPAAHAETSVATVNGKPIKQSLMDFILKDASEHGQKVDDATRAAIVAKLVGTEIVVQEGQRLGLYKQADFLVKEELARRELMVNAYLEHFAKNNPVPEAEIKSAYEQAKQQAGDKEYNARHILVKSENEAKELIVQLGKGADFAALAREKSLDPGTREKGGETGWFSPAAMVKPFSDAATGLQKGLYTTVPVQTQFGWHVIKLEDTRALQPPAYEKVKDVLQKQIQQRALDKTLRELRSKAKVVENGESPKAKEKVIETAEPPKAPAKTPARK